jgi:hypothetical protein
MRVLVNPRFDIRGSPPPTLKAELPRPLGGAATVAMLTPRSQDLQRQLGISDVGLVVAELKCIRSFRNFTVLLQAVVVWMLGKR